MTFAGPLALRICPAVPFVKKVLKVSIPLVTATAAILGAGSIPSTGIPSFLKAFKKFAQTPFGLLRLNLPFVWTI